jgi:2-keto-4-pentenoate hydratase
MAKRTLVRYGDARVRGRDEPRASGGGKMDIHEIASEVFAVLGTGRQVAPFSDRWPDFGLGDAYRVTAAVRAKREARGERPVGRKIGFTNRTIWAEYNVHAPIWGYVYDRTVRDLPGGGADISLTGLAEPRIEPEIVFGLASAPAPDMDNRALLGCIDWVAHGFEIVQSIFPDWRFLAADTVAAYGLHGALWIGPRHVIAGRSAHWGPELAAFEIDLFRNGVLADRGRAANVLDGPVFALRHLVQLLAADPVNPPLAAGEIVTTGTLTRAFPVAAGETWTTELTGVPLEGARLRFV